MRKLGALSLATFYLLLTTGVFACLVHCTETYLFTNATITELKHVDELGDDSDHHGQGKPGHSKGDKDDCGPGKDCNCCDKHGLYVVKENISSAFQFSATPLATLVSPASPYGFSFVPEFSMALVTWPHTTGPPRHSQPPVYITIRSLLI